MLQLTEDVTICSSVTKWGRMDQIRKDPITIVLKHGCSIAQRDQEGVAASFGSIKLGDIIISLITIGYADYLHTYYIVPKNAILP